jgi:hypothetical protein
MSGAEFAKSKGLLAGSRLGTDAPAAKPAASTRIGSKNVADA